MRVLVLSGGGSHGAWQAGAIRALSRKYSYDAVVGTSVGAVNAVGFSCVGSNGLQKLWSELDGTGRIMKLNIDWPWKLSGLFSFAPLRELLTNALQKNPPTIPAYITSLDLASGELCYDPATADSRATVDYLLGSCALAGIQEPTNGRVDGGHREVCPISFALNDLHADEVHAVYSDPLESNLGVWRVWSLFPILSVMLRVLQCMIDEITIGDRPVNDPRVRVFAPTAPIEYSSLVYHPPAMMGAYTRGYEETAARL